MGSAALVLFCGLAGDCHATVLTDYCIFRCVLCFHRWACNTPWCVSSYKYMALQPGRAGYTAQSMCVWSLLQPLQLPGGAHLCVSCAVPCGAVEQNLWLPAQQATWNRPDKGATMTRLNKPDPQS
jgi:hypothetical protein